MTGEVTVRGHEVFEVMAGVWCVRARSTSSCSYVVKQSPGAVLIDSSRDPTGAAMMMALQQARVGLSSVRAILVTHRHANVNAGLRALQDRTGAPVWAGPETVSSKAPSAWRRRLPEVGWLAALRGRPGPDGGIALSARELRDGRAVAEMFRAIATPGHTRSHFCFWLEARGLLFTGDALAVAPLGSGRLALPARGATEEVTEARRSLARLFEIEPGTVLPGLGAPLREEVAREWARGRAFCQREGPWPRFGGVLSGR